MKTIAFFNPRRGAGKTTLVYHLAHTLSQLEYAVLAVDLDPQAELIGRFLDEPEAERYPAVPIAVPKERWWPWRRPEWWQVTNGLSVLAVAEELELCLLEELFAERWLRALDHEAQALSFTSSIHTLIRVAVQQIPSSLRPEFVLLDLGSDLGALTRAGLLASDYFLIPLDAQASKEPFGAVGKRLRLWRQQWREAHGKAKGMKLPPGAMAPLGYVARLGRRSSSLAPFSAAYYRLLGKVPPPVDHDPACLAMLSPFYSLEEMAKAAGKPMFELTPADGAMGSYAPLVKKCDKEFEALALTVAEAAAAAPQVLDP
jgi:chromosome partitioning protein